MTTTGDCSSLEAGSGNFTTEIYRLDGVMCAAQLLSLISSSVFEKESRWGVVVLKLIIRSRAKIHSFIILWLILIDMAVARCMGLF